MPGSSTRRSAELDNASAAAAAGRGMCVLGGVGIAAAYAQGTMRATQSSSNGGGSGGAFVVVSAALPPSLIWCRVPPDALDDAVTVEVYGGAVSGRSEC